MKLHEFFDSKGIRIPLWCGVRLKGDGENHSLEDLFAEFAEIKCQEQRENCLGVMKHVKFGQYGAKKDVILNAPIPEME